MTNTQSINAPTICSKSFIQHNLPHITTISTERKKIFAGVGSALGVNDLDNDGDIDIVLANLDGPSAILWNQGNLIFEKQELSVQNTRAINIIDVNADSWLDIVFTHPGNPPSLWLSSNLSGTLEFTKTDQFGVWHVLNAMAWADLDLDGDLDMVGASYDGEIAEFYDGFVIGGGVAYYENNEGIFQAHELGRYAHALALLLTDLNEDNYLDIIVGNDFELPDHTWIWTTDGWHIVNIFEQMPRNTMSLAAADIDNDGQMELFAADMKPYSSDNATVYAWQELAENHDKLPEGDPQIEENILLKKDKSGKFINQARLSGVDASGWSWSAKFGDLDNDGMLDLYVVNGMYSESTFSHLVGSELIEQNQAFRNLGSGTFLQIPEWGLGSEAGGRGMSIADFDNDGDLDIVVNNFLSPSQLFENQLCGGSSLQIELRWPNTGNTHAIGAQLLLKTPNQTYIRETRSSSGFLSGDPNRVHFGIPESTLIEELEIVWPDGVRSYLKSPKSKSIITVKRIP